jgi:hypothetical protein
VWGLGSENPLHGVESSNLGAPREVLLEVMNPLHGVESLTSSAKVKNVGLENPLHGVESLAPQMTSACTPQESITWS